VIYRDRADAGRQLAERLGHLTAPDVVVLGLPRGGVAVGFEVAAALGATLDVIVVRKIGVPSQPELAMGALGEDGVLVVNREVLAAAGVDAERFAAVQRAEQTELDRRAAAYRGGRERVPLEGRTAIVVDDGLATGATARAACQVARASGAARVVLAVPVGPPGVERGFVGIADEVVCLESPATFFAIGEAYVDFSPTSDDAVIELLHRSPGR
jgi:putative phosphoribosyl transferase